MSLTYKICTINELEKLIEISKYTFVAAFEKDNNPVDFKNYIEEAFSKERMKEELTNPDSIFYFVYKDEILSGYFKINRKDAQNECFDEDSIELERIYVLANFQGQQIGKQILLKVIEIAKSFKASFLWLGVWEKNTNAIRFYDRYGFQKFGTHPYHVGKDKQTDWLMKLAL